MRRRLLAVAALAGAASSGAGAHPLAAQGVRAPSGKCALNVKFDRVTGIKLPSGQSNSFLGGNVVATCPNQRIVLRSDSLEVYGDEGRYYFVGHVDYSEPRLKLRSDYLTYFQRDERLLAFLNVDARLPSGSTLKGNQLEYLRAVPRVRPRQQGTAVGRPTITLVERDAQGKAQPPVTITGNTVYLQGDSTVAASGEVVVVRPELTATGDSLYLDGSTGLLRIMRTPKITGTRGRPFTLVGETIDLHSRRRKLERVLAQSHAEATSEDLRLTSDTIDLRIVDDQLQRAYVWGSARARATSPTQSIVSDSIEVVMPGQKVRAMHAIRSASAEGLPDTTRFRTTEKDRLTGDTIIALFDSVASRDTAAKPRIRELRAVGHATSLQHLASGDSSCHLPSINYLRARVIVAQFDSTGVKNVRARDTTNLAPGVFLEPKACSDSARRAVAAAAAEAQRTSPPPAGAATPGAASPGSPPAPAPRTPSPPPSAAVTPEPARRSQGTRP